MQVFRHSNGSHSDGRRGGRRPPLPRHALVGLSVALAIVGLASIAGAALSTAPAGQKAWYWQNPEPQGNTLYGLAAAGNDSLWAVGGPGVVLYSSNGGAVWTAQDPNTLAVLKAAAFVDQSTGWVVGDGGVVRTTGDGGLAWTAQSIDATPSDLTGIAMAGSANGWICGIDGTIRATTNAGAVWTLQSDQAERLNDITAVDADHAWTVGEAGAIRATADGGTTWVPQTNPASTELNAVDFFDAQIGLAVGDQGTVLKTDNAGLSWTTPVSVPTSGDLHDVVFVSATSAYAVCSDGSILMTSDAGDQWTEVGVSSRSLNAVVRTAQGTGLAVGFRGEMVRSVSAGQPWVPYSTAFDDLRDAAFDSAVRGCAVGANGAVLHTADGGLSWNRVDSGTGADLHAVDCVASGRGWVVGEGGVIRTSVDATSWVGQSTPTSQTLYDVDFVDDDYGWIVGAGATVLHTDDGGSVSWDAQAVPSEVSTLNAVSFVSTDTGWAAGADGYVISTTSAGTTWTVQSTPTSETLRGVSFSSTLVGYAVGDAGTMLKTVDGGAQWDVVTDSGAPVGVSYTDVAAVSDSHFIVVGNVAGNPSVVRRTVDGGATWAALTPGTGNPLNGIVALDADTAWIVGAGGTILRATDSAAPTTILSSNPAAPNGANGWYVTPPTLTLTADEPGITRYSWTSATGPWSTYLDSVPGPAEGVSTLYYYSEDAGGNVESPVGATQIKYDATAPTTPTALAASAESSHSVVLTWSESIDEQSSSITYQVSVDGSAVGTSTVAGMTLTGLTADTTYQFSVRAIDEAGNASPESQAVSATTLGVSARPPVAVYARSLGYRGAVVNWGEATGTIPPFEYRVWRSVAGGAFSAIATVTPSAARSFVDTSAPLFASVRYAVSVVDERGGGPVSTPTSYTVTSSEDLPAPVELSARNTASVTLTWSPSPLAAGYHVYRATTSTGTATTLTADPVTIASYLDTTTAAYSEYWYSVASVDASDNVGRPSAQVYIRTYSGDTSPAVEPPHGAYSTDTAMCAQCHATHSATSPRSLLTGTTTNDAPLCLSCHDGTSASDVLSDYLDPSRTSRHAVPFDEIAGSLNCSDCHGVHSSEQTETVRGLLLAGESKSGNTFCYECHGEGSTTGVRKDLLVFEASAHGGGVVEPPTGTKVVCLSCHVSHTSREASLVPYSSDDRCLRCHTAGVLAGGATDIASKLSGDGADTRHDLRSQDASVTGSRLSCGNCHEPHTSTATTPCVDPDSPTTTSTISASGTALCLRCHDDALPTSQDTSGWVSAPLGANGTTRTVDISASWESTSVHGAGSADSPQLRVSMGYAAGDELACGHCHDSHGSTNRFALKERVASKDGLTLSANGLVVPLAGGGADLRFFCDSCHDVAVTSHPAADLGQWPLDCTGCHAHVGGGL